MSVKVYDYSVAGDYTYDSDKILVSGGSATIREDLTNVYARYHLNESSGVNVPDSSDNSRDGTATNMEDGDWVSGKLNNCLSFDGTSEHVNLGDIADFERTDTFSIEFWLKTTTVGTVIISKMQISPDPRGWATFIAGTGKLAFRLTNSVASSNRILVTASTVITDNVWHHVVVTYDGSSSASGVTIYVDNSEESLSIVSDTLTATIQTTIKCILSSYGGTSNFFIGNLDEVVIYDKELTQPEVTYKYNSGTGRENGYYYSDKPTIEPTDLFDPATVSAWDSFLETTCGLCNIGYNLYKVDKANKYYWNGSAWVTGGDSTHYNSASVINDNISSFDVTPDKIGFIAYLISDGEQETELEENQITYSVNINPSVNAGSDKTCKDHEIIAPFSDCLFSDPDGTIDHVYYKIIGEVDTWTEITLNGYGSLLEAARAFLYQFENSGTITASLKVVDDSAAEAEDSLTVTVQKYIVTFNVKDSQDNHLADISFNPGDGTGYQTVDSPFDYEYEYNISGYDMIIDKDGYATQTKNIVSTDHTENFTLLALTTPSDIYDYFTDGNREDVFKADLTGLEASLERILGLSQENFRILSLSYDRGNNLTSAIIKIYPTAIDCSNDTNSTAEYTITATFNTKNLMTGYKVTKN